MLQADSLHSELPEKSKSTTCMLSRFSRVQPRAILWTVACHTPPSVGFSRQKYWSGLPFPSLGDLPTQGSKLCFPRCRQILYLLSHQGSPIYCDSRNKFLMTKLAVFKLFFLSCWREIGGMAGGGGRDLKMGRATDSKWGKRRWFYSGSRGGREVQRDTV